MTDVKRKAKEIEKKLKLSTI